MAVGKSDLLLSGLIALPNDVTLLDALNATIDAGVCDAVKVCSVVIRERRLVLKNV